LIKPGELYRKNKNELEAKINKTISNYLIADSKISILLDIGAGEKGSFNHPALNKYKRIAVDIDQIALNKNQTTPFKVCADIRNLPFDEKSVDAIISRDCLEHVEKVDIFFSEMRRIVKPGGVFLTILPNKNYLISLFAFLMPNVINNFFWRSLLNKSSMPYPVFYEINTKKSWMDFSKNYDFDIIKFEYFNYVSHWFLRLPRILFWLIMFLHLPLKLKLFENFSPVMLVLIQFHDSNE